MPIQTIAPRIPVRDVAASCKFYGTHLGFETLMLMPDQSYGIVTRDGQQIHLVQAEDEKALECTRNQIAVYIRVTELDAIWQAVEASRPPTRHKGPEEKPWGMKEFHILDPDGALLFFGQSLDS